MGKKTFFGGACLLLIYLLTEGMIFCALLYLEKTKGVVYDPVPACALSDIHKSVIGKFLAGDFYLKFSPSMGWTIRSNAIIHYRFKTDKSVFARSNFQGIRSDREYAPKAPEGILRVAAFGDSMTHGDNVRNAETWPAQLEKMDPALEVMNFGVPAYGIDQAYLRYLEEGARFGPRIVLIGFFPENIMRTVNAFRPFFYTGDYLPLAKPRFILKNGQLELLATPFSKLTDYRSLLDNPGPALARLGVNDYYFRVYYHQGPFDFLPSVRLAKIGRFSPVKRLPRPKEMFDFYRPDAEAFRVTARILEMFYQKVLENGSLPIIVFLPPRNEPRFYARTGEKTYDLMEDYLKKSGLRFTDVMEDIARTGYGEALFAQPGHYNEEENKMVAGALYRYLSGQGFLDARIVDRAIEKERAEMPAEKLAGQKA